MGNMGRVANAQERHSVSNLCQIKYADHWQWDFYTGSVEAWVNKTATSAADQQGVNGSCAIVRQRQRRRGGKHARMERERVGCHAGGHARGLVWPKRIKGWGETEAHDPLCQPQRHQPERKLHWNMSFLIFLQSKRQTSLPNRDEPANFFLDRCGSRAVLKTTTKVYTQQLAISTKLIVCSLSNSSDPTNRGSQPHITSSAAKPLELFPESTNYSSSRFSGMFCSKSLTLLQT